MEREGGVKKSQKSCRRRKWTPPSRVFLNNGMIYFFPFFVKNGPNEWKEKHLLICARQIVSVGPLEESVTVGTSGILYHFAT